MMDFSPLHKPSAQPNSTAHYSAAADNSTSPSRFTTANTPGSPASLSAVQLPPIDTAPFMSGRHEVNPAIALNLLRDIQTAITQWQAQQRQVIAAMRALYDQGPMVDGWLESTVSSQTNPAQSQPTKNADSSATILRHGDADALMQYVESLEGSHSQHLAPESVSEPNTNRDPKSQSPVSAEAPPQQGQSEYWLCRLNDNGSVHSQRCPPEQMAVVGSAIARFQKFKQLKLQQQTLEVKLQEAVDSLTGFRDHLCR